MEKAVQKRLETKTRDSQLFETLTHQFEFSPKTAEAIIETVKEKYELHRWDPDQETGTGGVSRQVIAVKAKHGPRLRELPMVTVNLTLDKGQEDGEVRRSHGTKSLRQMRISRMSEEALDQGGILSQEDLSDLLQVDVRTVRRDVHALTKKGVRVQTRGAYHDIGPTLSHKAWIVSLYLQYHTYSEIARRTRHSTSAIKRYLRDFGRVMICSKKALNIAETAHVAGISERLTEEYLALYHDYNIPEYADRLEDLVTKSNPSTPMAKGKKGAKKT